MYWYDGERIETDQITLPINDPGLIYGATVFTTLRLWQQSLDHPLSFWSAHCDRLKSSVAQLGWSSPNWTRVRQGAEQVGRLYPVLRITLFPDGREWITGRPLPQTMSQVTDEEHEQGISAWLAPADWRRSLPHVKTGNYLACWLALTQARQQGYQEAILTDPAGNWLETSTGNLWGWYDHCWWTPPLHPDQQSDRKSDPIGAPEGEALILPGIGRSHLMQVLKWHNIRICEEVWSIDLVQCFEALCYTNSVRHTVAIAHVYGTESSSGPIVTVQPQHPARHRLAALFETIVPTDDNRDSNLR